jgi:hypothetical protein
LTDTQGEELAKLINGLKESEVARLTFDSMVGEAENCGEGRGELLRAVWNNAKEKAAFFKDQQSNSKFVH